MLDGDFDKAGMDMDQIGFMDQDVVSYRIVSVGRWTIRKDDFARVLFFCPPLSLTFHLTPCSWFTTHVQRDSRRTLPLLLAFTSFSFHHFWHFVYQSFSHYLSIMDWTRFGRYLAILLCI
jgi:hypothetical protein